MAKEETAPAIDPTDIWGRIPPEEKLEILAKAQGRGVGAAVVLILVGCTLAVGFKFVWLMWGSILLSPLIYQFVAGKAWRDLKPPVVLEYLAARSATRRYAFAAKSKDLYLQLLFRGEAEQALIDREMDQSLSEAFKQERVDVWVALFNDCVVIIREAFGGAACVMAHILDERLTIQGSSPAGEGEYSRQREVLLTFSNRKGEKGALKITSRFPAALVVFERKALRLQSELRTKALGLPMEPAPSFEDDGLSTAAWES
jgi:hypothetical protein